LEVLDENNYRTDLLIKLKELFGVTARENYCGTGKE